MTVRVLAVSADWAQPPPDDDGNQRAPVPGGCYWYRLKVPLDALAAQGLVEWVGTGDIAQKPGSGEILAQTWDGKVLDGFDVVIIQRWMHADAERVITGAREAGQVVLQDIDDLFLDLSPHNDAFWHTHPNPEKALAKYRRKAHAGDTDAARIVARIAPKIGELTRTDVRYRASHRRNYLRSLRASDGIWVSTPYLAARYSQTHPNVAVLRNAIDMDRWAPCRAVRDEQQAALDSECPLKLGWHGSTAHRSGDWETMRGILAPWLQRHPDWQLAHLGAHRDHYRLAELAGVPPDRVLVAPPVPVMHVQEFIWGFTAGIVPLASVSFNHSKSCLKAMEMAGVGVPVVSARSAEYDWWGVGVVPSNRPHAWWDALDAMCDPAERARRVAEQDVRLQDMTIDRCWPAWADALEAAVAAPRKSRVG